MAETTTFGGTTVPLPASPAGRVADPIAAMLLDYIGWYFNKALNPQIALLYPSAAVTIPTTSRYNYDPKDVWPQNGVPALYLHWKSARSQPWSILKDRDVSTYELTYIAPERSDPTGSDDVGGIIAVASRVLRLAADRGWHPEYSYNGAPLGEAPHFTVGFQGWEVTDTQSGVYRQVPSRASGARRDYYPTLKAMIRTYTIIEQPTPQDPAEALGNTTATINTTGLPDLYDTVEFAQVTLPAPDGSADGDE